MQSMIMQEAEKVSWKYVICDVVYVKYPLPPTTVETSDECLSTTKK